MQGIRDFVRIMGNLLKRENIYPVRFAKDFFGDSLEIGNRRRHQPGIPSARGRMVEIAILGSKRVTTDAGREAQQNHAHRFGESCRSARCNSTNAHAWWAAG
jgi:hypothetical protein